MPWQKGQSGNPGGRSKGARTKATDAFILGAGPRLGDAR
jgi:hypothetical protein